jgi:5'(3')-deoxyribonucleotidase
MNISDIILGIDFGNTIETKNSHGVMVELPRAIEVIRRCVKHCKSVYIISKVNSRQMVEVVEWIHNHGFFSFTGLPIENVRFSSSRSGKGPIVKELKITHMIDDRPEVMASLPKSVVKYLMNPNMEDVIRWNQEKTTRVSSWDEIEQLLFES